MDDNDRFDEGYDEGYGAGYEDGRDEGHSDGYEECASHLNEDITRLKAVNEELVKALEQCVGVCAGDIMHKSGLINALELARTALAKAKELK